VRPSISAHGVYVGQGCAKPGAITGHWILYLYLVPREGLHSFVGSWRAMVVMLMLGRVGSGTKLSWR
jgi:hypothetical protein